MCTIITNFLQKNKLVYYLTILVISVSCSVHAPRSSVNAFHGENRLLPFTDYENENYHIHIRALGNEHKLLAFEVITTNKNLDSLVVDPQDWKLAYTTSRSLQAHQQMDTLQVITPQEVSLMYDSLAERVRINRQTAAGVGTFLAIVLVVGIVVIALKSSDSSNEGSSDSCEDSGSISVSFSSGGSANRGEDGPQIAYFYSRSEAIEAESFNRHVLGRGESTSFVLYFNRFNRMKYVNLIGPVIPGEQIRWDQWFEHKIIRE